jgi:hypothetical protein
MKNSLISTTAALALLAGTSIAFAQSGGSSGGSSPSGGGAGGAQQQQGGGAAGQDGGQQPGRSGTDTQSPRRSGQQGQQQQGQQQGQPQQGQQRQGQQAPQQSRDGARGDRAGGNERNGERNGERTGGNDRNRETTGSGHSSVTINTEQRSKIREHRTQFNAGRVDTVNFAISVGTAVPRSVRVHTLPTSIVEIVPEYRGYSYILVGEEILIIDPETLRIVAVIDA